MERCSITWGENKQRPRDQEPTLEDPLLIEGEYTWERQQGKRKKKHRVEGKPGEGWVPETICIANWRKDALRCYWEAWKVSTDLVTGDIGDIRETWARGQGEMKGWITYLREKYSCTLTPDRLNFSKVLQILYLGIIFINMRNFFNLVDLVLLNLPEIVLLPLAFRMS